MRNKHIIFSLWFLCLSFMLYSQEAEHKNIRDYTREEILYLSKEELLELPLEDVMFLVQKLKLTSIGEFYALFVNPKVKSASKKEEKLLNAPLTINIISHEELMNSGALNIPEALRLIPNVIVREKTNGNYDVHIRGNDNIPPGKLLFDSENTLTLVMIDNRPVYNNFQGGTFWESLPVSLEDIEKIEVVSSTCTSMYGPNAVTGVIHIITRKSSAQKNKTQVSAQAGTYQTYKAYIRAGHTFHKNFSAGISANYQHRNRFQEKLYNFYESRYMSVESLENFTFDFNKRYPNPNLALENAAVNVFANYKDKSLTLDVSTGTQYSYIQTIYLDIEDIPITGRKSNMSYLDIKGNWKNLETQFSINKGVQDNNLGIDGYKFDITDLFSKVEYSFKYKKFLFSPGVSFTSSSFDDTSQNQSSSDLLFGKKVNLNNLAGYLRSEYKPTDYLRFIASFRIDKYKLPDKNYLSLQLSAEYFIDKNSTVHINYGRAHRGPFMYYYQLNTQEVYSFTETGQSILFSFKSNPELKLISMDMLEFSLKHLFNKNFSADFTVYYYQTKNYPIKKVNRISDFVFEESYVNSDLKSYITGASVIFKYTINQKLMLKLFGNIQLTTLENFNPNIYSPPAPIDMIHKTTPSSYGGFSVNYIPLKKWNIFTNLYVMKKQEFYSIDGMLPLKTSWIWNMKLSYAFYENCNLFINGRNLLNSTHIEFPFSDKKATMVLLGVNLKY